jgi:hypothetical protein
MLPPTQLQTQNMTSTRSNLTSPNDKRLSIIAKSHLVEYIPKHNLEKKIDPTQTRFPAKSIIPLTRFLNQHNQGSSLLDASETDDSDSCYTTDTSLYYSTDLDAPFRPIDHERQQREKRLLRKKQQQSHQSYVAMTPQITPGGGNASPITTWGTIDQTPLVLSGKNLTTDEESNAMDDGHVPVFSMPAYNHQEDVARRAEMELIRRAKRAKQKQTTTTTTTRMASTTRSATRSNAKSSSSSRTKSSLTPAAMSLLQKTTGRLPSRSRDAFGSALRTSYSQSSSRPKSNLSSHNKNDGQQTPSLLL